jgi:hypothetical protein
LDPREPQQSKTDQNGAGLEAVGEPITMVEMDGS